MKRPNILFCLADDASHFGIDGYDFVKTPNIDEIGRRGIHLSNMYTTNPKCAPSRASLLTGQHTWQLKEAASHWNVFPGPDEITVYPDILESHGYLVGMTGKGWGPGDFERRGRTRNPAGTAYNQIHLTPPENTGIASFDYTENFRAFLNDRNEDQPFCFWFGCIEPHRPYVKGEGRRNGKNPDDIKTVPPYWPDTPEVREDMCDYAFEIEHFDTQIGQMLKILEDMGELDNTFVIVTSDNGCPFPRVKGNMYEDDFRLPCVAMWNDRFKNMGTSKALCSFTDFAPTFLDIAGVPQGQHSFYGRSLLDVLTGQPEKRERVFMGRERHDMGREGDVGYPVRSIRTPEHLYIRNFKPELWPAGNPETGYTDCDGSPTKDKILELHEKGQSESFELCFGKRPLEELYDISVDPYCINNLAQEPEHRQLCEQLWSELQEELQNTGDPRIQGQGDFFDQLEYVGACPHSWKHYLEGTWKPQGY